MHNVQVLNIEEQISHTSVFSYACNGTKNIAKYCGRVVQSKANKLFTTSLTCTHILYFQFIKNLIARLYTFYKLFNHHTIHKKCVQFLSVIAGLYTQSTRPTITTTYINK